MPLDKKRGDLYYLLFQFEIEIKVICDIETSQFDLLPST